MTLQQWRLSLLLISSIYLKKEKTSRVAVYATLLITRASGNAAPRPLVSGTDRNQLFNDRSADPLLAAADKAHCTRTRRALGSARLSLTKRAAVPHGRGFWPRSPRARQKRRVQSNLVLITRVKAIPPTLSRGTAERTRFRCHFGYFTRDKVKNICFGLDEVRKMEFKTFQREFNHFSCINRSLRL